MSALPTPLDLQQIAPGIAGTGPLGMSYSANAGLPGMAMPGQMPNIGGGSGGLGTLGTVNAALSGLQTIGNLWNSWQQMKLAKKQFNHTKKVTDTNLANSIQSYNTALEDRGRSRAYTEGQSQQEASSYISKNRLPEYRG